MKLIKRYPSIFFLLCCIALMGRSWHQWADTLNDSGYNLYTFLQLSLGKYLYKDLAYYHGPISPLFCGLVFRIFGATIQSLALVNMFIVWGLACLIYQIFKNLFSIPTALLCVVCFLFVFAFSQYDINAAHNFILPYKPEVLYGTLFALLYIYSFQNFLKREAPIYLILSGISIGCMLLCSLDFFIVSILISLSSLTLISLRGLKKIKISHFLSIFLFSLILPLILSILYLSTYLPLNKSIEFTFQALAFPLQNSSLVKNPYFIAISGANNIAGNFYKIFISFFLFIILLGFLLFLSTIFVKWKKESIKIIGGGAAILLCAGASLFLGIYKINIESSPWQQFMLMIPPVLLLAVLHSTIQFLKFKSKEEFSNRWLIILIFGVFSLGMISKIFFNPSISNYGFYLSMPGVLFLIAYTTCLLPELLETVKINGSLLKSFFNAATIFLILYYFQFSSKIFSSKSFILSQGKNGIASWSEKLTDQGIILKLALLWIHDNIPEKEPLLVLPEGSILNYLTYHESIGPYTMSPIEVLAHGEDAILKIYREKQPSYIAIISRDASAYGFNKFGLDQSYGKSTLAWINKNYKLIIQIGKNPMESDYFGIQFYKKI